MKRIRYELVLDSQGLVELFVDFFLGENSKIVEDFVIILFYYCEGKKVEVIKYDYSRKEKFHVHKYYSNPTRKEYLEKEVTPETIIQIKEEIKENWKKYIELFERNHYI